MAWLRIRQRPCMRARQPGDNPPAWNGENNFTCPIHDIDHESIRDSEHHMGPGRSAFDEDLGQPQRNLMGRFNTRQIQAPGIFHTTMFRTNVKVMVRHEAILAEHAEHPMCHSGLLHAFSIRQRPTAKQWPRQQILPPASPNMSVWWHPQTGLF